MGMGIQMTRRAGYETKIKTPAKVRFQPARKIFLPSGFSLKFKEIQG
jgi:hypothetical protein